MARRYAVSRLVTGLDTEGVPADLTAGAVVYECRKPTYGCISDAGIACTLSPSGDYPFFELPKDALEPLTGPA